MGFWDDNRTFIIIRIISFKLKWSPIPSSKSWPVFLCFFKTDLTWILIIKKQQIREEIPNHQLRFFFSERAGNILDLVSRIESTLPAHELQLATPLWSPRSQKSPSPSFREIGRIGLSESAWKSWGSRPVLELKSGEQFPWVPVVRRKKAEERDSGQGAVEIVPNSRITPSWQNKNTFMAAVVHCLWNSTG